MAPTILFVVFEKDKSSTPMRPNPDTTSATKYIAGITKPRRINAAHIVDYSEIKYGGDNPPKAKLAYLRGQELIEVTVEETVEEIDAMLGVDH